MFIGSSSEGIPVAEAIHKELDAHSELVVEPWYKKSKFKLSRSYLDSLMGILDDHDLGVFVLSPDDSKTMRHKRMRTPRDNVVFELGLFMGRHGCGRAFMVTQKGVPDSWIPSDLKGIHAVSYDPKPQHRAQAVSQVCETILEQLAGERSYTWLTEWRSRSGVYHEQLILSKRAVANSDAHEVRGVRILRPGSGKPHRFRVSGRQWGASYWLVYHGEPEHPVGGTIALKDLNNEKLCGYVVHADKTLGGILCTENQWVLDTSGIRHNPAWQRPLGVGSPARMTSQEAAVSLLMSSLERQNIRYLDYYDPQKLTNAQLPRNECEWGDAVERFLKGGGRVRYVFAANDPRKVAQHNRWQRMEAKYSGRRFQCNFNLGLSVMMFGESPETIDSAVVFVDTTTNMPVILEIKDSQLLQTLHLWFDFLYAAGGVKS